jgi:hypothetical protein
MPGVTVDHNADGTSTITAETGGETSSVTVETVYAEVASNAAMDSLEESAGWVAEGAPDTPAECADYARGAAEYAADVAAGRVDPD